MKENKRNILTITIIVLVTALTLYLLPVIPNFLKPVEPDDIVGFQPKFILLFLGFVVIFIGIPAWIHRIYVSDYSKIKSVWFFTLFGGVTGALLGEQGNPVMIIPYTILMLIYAYFYKKFTWWKVALTAYLGGIVVENIINRSPIQIPTLMWVAFFIYPYFVTKIYENRKKVGIFKILKDLKWSVAASIMLTALAIYASRNNISPPLIILAALLPFLITILYRVIKKRE